MSYDQQPGFGQNGQAGTSSQPQYGQPQYGQFPYGQPQQLYGQPQPQYGPPVGDQGTPNGYYGSQQGSAQQGPAYAQQPGYSPYRQPMAMSSKSKIAAGLLGIFLGGLGVHNFYLGNTGKAVVQLLLTLVGWIVVVGPMISGIWGLVEGIMILASHPGNSWHRDSDGYELQD